PPVGWIISSARRRQPGVKVARARERLSDDSRSHDLAVSYDQLSVGAVREQYLGQTCDSQRVQNSEHHRRNQGEPQSDQKILFHKFLKQSEDTSAIRR